MKHVVFFSGGVASYVAAKRVVEKYGTSDLILLFTDTKVEDADLYRFLKDASAKIGVEITYLAEGRTIWQVFKDVRMLGNSRLDPCSRVLKREQSRKFISRYATDEVTLYLGFDWNEFHRLERAKRFWSPYQVEAPLTNYPYLSKEDMFAICEADGIKVPRLYSYGLTHNNCGGGCVKAGIGHFVLLLENLPDVFAGWEKNEQSVREHLGKDVSILTRTRNGVKSPFTLRQLREERESLTKWELCEIGGCGCFDNADDEFGISKLLFGDLFSKVDA